MYRLIVKKPIVSIGVGLFFLTFFGISFNVNNKVFADCGADGVGIHGYAGAVIDVVIKKSDGTTRQATDSVVYVQTVNPSTPSGNIYNLNTGKRYVSANFKQINNSCPGTTGGQSVVLGYGTTSQPTGGDVGQWALDCDKSIRITSTQPFNVTSRGTPNGARALYGPYLNNSNYGWTTQTISPSNGQTAHTTIVYREPPPSATPVNDGQINFVDCRNFTSVGVEKNTTINARYIVRWKQYPGSGLQTIANGSVSSTVYSMPVYYGPSTMPNVPYYVDILILRGTTWVIADSVTTNNEPCGQNKEYRPTYSLEVTCDGVWVRTPYDRDNQTDGIRIYGQFYHRYVNGGVESYNPAGGTNYDLTIYGDTLLRWPWASDDGVNQGWGMWIGNYDTSPLGQKINPTWAYSAELEGACHQATCSIDVQESAEVSRFQNAVIANKPFSGTVTVSNPATTVPVAVYRHPDNPSGNGTWQQLGSGSVPNVNLPDTLGGSQLNAHSQNGMNKDIIDLLTSPADVISRGGSVTRSFTFTAPDTVGTTSIEYYPDYTGRLIIGQACSNPVDVYKPFDITPKADTVTLAPYAEDPLTATFTSSTIKNNPSGASIPGVVATRKIARNGTQIGSFNAPNPYRAGDPSDTRNFSDTANIPQPNKLNDGFCGEITVSPATGWIGPNDRVVVKDLTASDSTPGCTGITVNPPGGPNGGELVPKVVNQPYVKSYGGDVVAGGGFTSAGGSCATTPSSGTGIFSFIAPLNYQVSRNRSGSGAQLGAMAWGANVSGFTSASTRTTAPASGGGNKLTFANATGDPASQEPVLGGNLNGAPPCLPDYFNETQYPEGDQKVIGNTTSVDVVTLASNQQTLFSTPTEIKASNSNYKSRHTIYVDGDAWISSNIIYSRAGVSEAKKMPNFTLVVKGNIYIDKSVTRLDGTYIAQPLDDGSKGVIYTCSTGYNAILAPDALYSQCGAGGGARQLYVYGSFIAEKVRLNRTANSIKDSSYREGINTTAGAEVFSFYPDVYLSQPVFRPKATVTSGDYQYIATLPPIL